MEENSFFSLNKAHNKFHCDTHTHTLIFVGLKHTRPFLIGAFQPLRVCYFRWFEIVTIPQKIGDEKHLISINPKTKTKTQHTHTQFI